jgi:hypothetical protein
VLRRAARDYKSRRLDRRRTLFEEQGAGDTAGLLVKLIRSPGPLTNKISKQKK